MSIRSRREDFLVFGKPVIGEEEIEEVVNTLRSGWWGTGPKTEISRINSVHIRKQNLPYRLTLLLQVFT